MRQIWILLVLGSASQLHAENTFQIISDPMSDVSRGIAVINASGKIMPVVKCDTSGKSSLYVSFIADQYLGAVRYKTRNIKVRFDGGTPYELSAYHDGKTASVMDLDPNKISGQLLRDMMNAKNMVIQLTTYNYDQVTDAFDLGNSAEVIQKAASTCRDTNWVSVAQ